MDNRRREQRHHLLYRPAHRAIWLCPRQSVLHRPVLLQPLELAQALISLIPTCFSQKTPQSPQSGFLGAKIIGKELELVSRTGSLVLKYFL